MSHIVNTKFFTIFSSLSEEKQKAFLAFAQIPQFNPSNKVKEFIASLINQPQITNKKELYEIIYATKSYNDVDLRMILSKAYFLCIQYIATDALLNNLSDTYKIVLDKQVNEKKDLLNKLKEELSNDKQSVAFFKNAYFYENQKFEYEYQHQLSSKRQISLDFKDLDQAQETYFLIEKLKILLVKVNYAAMVQQEGNYAFTQNLQVILANIENIPALAQLYVNCINLYLEPQNADNFLQMNELLASYEENIAEKELRELYKHVQNYCIRMINQGNSLYLKHLFTIYEKMFANKTILENNQLSQWTLKNVVAAGIRLQEFEKTTAIIENYKDYIVSNERESAYHYNTACINFERREFSACLINLQKVYFKDIFYQLGTKVLIAKTYFEIEDDDGLLYTLDNIKKLLTRKKDLTERHINTHKNFAKFIKKIRFAQKQDNAKLLSLLESTKLVAERAWLLSKLS